MSDIKLFRLNDGAVAELASQSPQVEKSLQALFEKNLEVLLGVRFLASEYSTGAVHGGRLDSLGIDEDNTPVIIEYKRTSSESVMNQGLFYLSWLLDHRSEFNWLVMNKMGKGVADNVDWSSPRIICIANDFSKYDLHAVTQIQRSIELIRYRRFGDDMLLIEQVNTPRQNSKSSATPTGMPDGEVHAAPVAGSKVPHQSQLMDYRLRNASEDLRYLFKSVDVYLTSLGDDVQVKELKFYHAYKRIKNFVCLELYPSENKVTAFLKLDPDTVSLEPGFTRDMRKISHFGTGNLEVAIRSDGDLDKALPLFDRAYLES